MAKSKKPDYRALKKKLNKYHKFTFPMPRKGKDFTPAQKAAITRAAKRLEPSIDNTKSVTFIPYKKGRKYSGLDGLRTAKGIFILEPKAKIQKDKTGKDIVVTTIGDFDVKNYYFPRRVIDNPSMIEGYVAYLLSIQKREVFSIMWLRHGALSKVRYAPELFYKYFDPNSGEAIDFTKKSNDDAHNKVGYIVGVSFYFEN